MTAKSKIWLLAAVVAALGAGVIWKALHHGDHPSDRPAVVASASKPRGDGTQVATAPAGAPAASSGSGENSSLSKGESTAASSPPEVVSRPDSSGAMGGAIGGLLGGGPADAGLYQARGTIVVYTSHVVVLASENKGKLEFDVPDAPGAAMTTAGLRKGDPVVVGYTEANGRKVAKSISRVQTQMASPAPVAEPKD